MLAGLIVVEIVVFAISGTNFLTPRNAGEIACASAEVAILAIALTPVVLTGGIDLSSGSLLGLSAVVLGASWRDLGLPFPAAVAAALLVGLSGGLLNALLVARAGLPPLIVTLATFSLFRGVAEGISGGVRNYADFPAWFLAVGQGGIGGLPAQVPIVLMAALAVAILVHRMAVGRTLRAIGFSPDGARHAGIPVARRLTLVYALSGISAGVAALVYAARLGQAKADAGTGFELMAVTAVVLGGTSIFGGRGQRRRHAARHPGAGHSAERPEARRPAHGARRDPDGRAPHRCRRPRQPAPDLSPGARSSSAWSMQAVPRLCRRVSQPASQPSP